MKQNSLLIILLGGTALLTQGELLMTVQTNAQHIQITLSGSADISGLTPETRSSSAFFGESGMVFGNHPNPNDPLAGLQQYNAYALDLYPADSFATAAPAALFGNGLRDPALTYTSTSTPMGFFYGDNFETVDPDDTLGELYLPVGYVSGTELSGSLTLNDRTFADFGWNEGETYSFSWNNGQDTLTFNVVPEPATFTLILCVALGLYAFRCIQRHAREPLSELPSTIL